MTRRSLIFGAFIIGCWAVTMGFLVKNYYLDPVAPAEYQPENLFGSVTPIVRWEDIEEYMLIVQAKAAGEDTSVVGAMATHITMVDDPSSTQTYSATFHLEGKLSPLLPAANVKVSSLLDKNVNLTAFHGVASLGPAQFSATGTLFNSTLYLETHKPNGSNKLKREINGPVSMAEAMRPALGRQIDIEPGAKMSTPILDPLTGQSRGILTIQIGNKELISVAGESVEAFRVTSTIGDIATVMWVDDDGNTLKRQLVGGLSMERTTKDRALAQAPSLDEPVGIPALDPADFRGIPTTRGGDSSSGNSAGGLGMLEALLN